MKIGITTTGRQKYSVILLYFLISKSIKPDCIIVIKGSLYKRIIRNLNFKRIKTSFDAIWHRKDKHPQKPKRDFLEHYTRRNNIVLHDISLLEACQKEKVKYVKVNDINSRRIIKYIKEAHLDILINAGGGIFRSNIINSLTLGILNAHMGYLPDFRGMNVLEWSLFYNREIGVTLHFIDEGIDTGDILLFKNIPVEKGDTIEDLRKESGVYNMQLIFEGIKGLKTGTLLRKKQIINEGKQYFVMHPRLKMIVERKLNKNLYINQY